jgi:outer membrane receptor protein involved in Fe transport
MGRRNIEGQGRLTNWEHNNFRYVLGIKGDFADAWSYDAYFSYYYTSLFDGNYDYLSNTKVQNALLVGGTAAKPVCLGGQAGCVPYNIWTQGAVTPAQENYLLTSGTSYGTVTERIEQATVTGELGKYGVKLPTANEGVAVVAGYDYRSDFLNYAPDAAEGSNDLSGFSGAGVAIDNGYHVNEGFAEVRVPLVQQKPFLEDLVLHGAYRHSNYSTNGGVNTYAIDLQWAPTPDLRFRGSFQRAIRAANIIELFTPQSVTNTSVVAADPCAGPIPAASLTECQRTGVTPAQYGFIPQCPAGQCATLTGGNPALTPEQSNTVSYGVTFTPSFLTGLTASLDYYQIIVKNVISSVPLTTSLESCLTLGLLCDNLHRAANGDLFGTTLSSGYIIGTAVNVAVTTAEGIDLQARYKWGVGKLGNMSAEINGTYLHSAQSQPTPASTRYDCVGLYGPTCVTLNPRWKHNLRLNWDITPIKAILSLQWRYFGPVELESNTGNPALENRTPPYGPGVFDALDARIAGYSYFDLTAFYNVNKWLQLRAGCQNILDKSPPLLNAALTATGSGNTYSQYDLLGRQIFGAFTITF